MEKETKEENNTRKVPVSGRPPICAIGLSVDLHKDDLEYDIHSDDPVINNFIVGYFNQRPSLTHFILNQWTDNLAQHISMKRLVSLTRIYRTLSAVSKDIGEMAGRDSSVFPDKEIVEIVEHLNDLKGKRWITDADVTELKNSLTWKMCTGVRGSLGIGKKMRAIYKEDGTLKAGAKKDIAFDFLLYQLVQYMKATSGKKDYPLLLEFLREQDIIKELDVEYNDNSLMRHYNRIKPEELKDGYNRLRDAFIQTTSLQSINDPHAKTMRDIIKCIIPPIETFSL